MAFDIPVKFGSVTVTDGTASIGFALDANTELTGTLLLKDPNREAPRLFDDHGDLLPSLEAHFQLTGKLTVELNDYSVPSECIDELIEMAKRRGVLILEGVSAPIKGAHIDEDDDTEDDGPDEHPDVAAGADRPVGTPALVAAAQSELRTHLVSIGLTDKQASAIIVATGCGTLEQLRMDVIADNLDWQDYLANIRGVGKAAVAKIAAAEGGGQ